MKHYSRLSLGISTILLAGTMGLSPAFAEEAAPRSIDAVAYNASQGELTLTSHDGNAMEAANVLHRFGRRELVFDIPGATVSPSMKEYTVENDPVVRSVSLSPIMEHGKPTQATRVKIRLWTKAPFLPFMMVPTQPGLKLVFTRTMDTVATTGQTAGGAASTSSTGISDATRTGTEKMTASVLGPVSEETFSVIQDVFFDENALTVVSKTHPIEVKRSFVLNEPNRYIVDISPAVLESRSLMRAIPQNHPDITSMKTGQFDENTVRIVVQFSDKVKPVDLSQWEGNKVLKLNF